MDGGALVKIVLFSHPAFMASTSMPRFAQMLRSAYEARGYPVEVWSPAARVINWVPKGRLTKWAGYVDQYLLFPIWVRKALRRTTPDTIFVFCDQALGPWVPMAADRPHAVHVHDLLALRSALGDFPENPTSFTGRLYQRYIRRGFQKARHFICISKKTRDDIQRFGGIAPITLDVVYNGLNYPYVPMPRQIAAQLLRSAGLAVPEAGMLLHVGGGQWYKNLAGVISLYAKYAQLQDHPLPLWCIGPLPSGAAHAALSKVGPKGRVEFFQNLDARSLNAAYACARAFLFPSLAEGFGWPLIEALACECAVITTDEAPMNEIAGDAAYFLPRLPFGADMDEWATHGARVVTGVLEEDVAVRAQRAERGRQWANRFDSNRAVEGYLAVYHAVIGASESRDDAPSALKPRAQS